MQHTAGITDLHNNNYLLSRAVVIRILISPTSLIRSSVRVWPRHIAPPGSIIIMRMSTMHATAASDHNIYCCCGGGGVDSMLMSTPPRPFDPSGRIWSQPQRAPASPADGGRSSHLINCVRAHERLSKLYAITCECYGIWHGAHTGCCYACLDGFIRRCKMYFSHA